MNVSSNLQWKVMESNLRNTDTIPRMDTWAHIEPSNRVHIKMAVRYFSDMQYNRAL
jgi:hypothetical protein